MFQNGQPVTRAWKKLCPKNKTPALLLTCKTVVTAQYIDHGDELVRVLTLTQVRNAKADIGETLFAPERIQIDLDNVSQVDVSPAAAPALLLAAMESIEPEKVAELVSPSIN